ncbi:hypothetical protein FACS189476_01960 [Spirochaetia bacterium]|nr:hypothetical protein FACS189476_01960 [Spirochaetia bacterium]
MTNYDLLSLSWLEFEDLTRDLLQSEFNIHIESFTAGRDEGIDLRFALTNNKKAIVQCKRYEKYDALYRQLKKEMKIISQKNIERYYISTTVGLTPNRKEKIYDLFYPLIKDVQDIFGKDDIINLISKHNSIEEKYYKLWITSTNVLKNILNAKVHNSTKIELQQIKNAVSIYVYNESYNIAQKILNENHYIIISGIPGIGKTTLARMLVYNLLASGINELVYISSNVGDAYKSFYGPTNQIFLFDDFLGSNFLEEKLDRNEDRQLALFIEKIKDSKNKYFIMTTREYILKQAQQKYELLNRHNIDIAKCIIDISLYTPIIKAKILYNHLFFSRIPQKYLVELLKDKRYFNFINHKNYNPRIIETIIDREEWEFIPSDKYYQVFLEYFNNPTSVWKHAFENQISNLSRVIIIILGSINGFILLDKLKKVTKNYLKYNEYYQVINFDIEFEKSLKELAGSFINVEKDKNRRDAICFYNPSVFDFIVLYLLDSKDIIISIIKSSLFLDQFLTIYKIYNNTLPMEIKVLCENEVLKRFNELEIIKTNKSTNFPSNQFYWVTESQAIIKKIYYLSISITPIENKNLYLFLKDLFFYEIEKKLPDYFYEEIIETFNCFYEIFDDEKTIWLLNNLIDNCETVDNLKELHGMKDIDSTIFNTVCKNEMTINKVNNIIKNEYINVDSYEYLKDAIEEISELYDINCDEYINKLEEKIDEEKESDKAIDIYNKYEKTKEENNDNNEITELFDTLLFK